MTTSRVVHTLTELLDTIESVAEKQERVSIDDVLDAVGRRSFGPVVMLIGLFLVVPGLSDIPSVPTIMGVLLVTMVAQLALHRESIWLPRWLLRRSVKDKHLQTTLRWARKPAVIIDRVSSARLRSLVQNRFTRYFSALLCVGFALATPAMEVVPLSANVAGLSIFLLGLALTTVDGLILLLALTVYLSTVAWVVFSLV